MKKHLLSLIAAAWVAVSSVAAPINGFKYQAVVRNNQGVVIENSAVLLKVSILQGAENGTSVYSEQHEITTNAFGLINVIIGNGTSPIGNFTTIDWSGNSYFLKVEMAVAPNTTLELLGVSPLLAVPYALHAETVANNNDADADPVNEIQQITLTGTTLSISQANSVDLTPFVTTDTDEQTLDLTADELSISNGNSVNLAPYKDNTDAQNLNLTGTTLAITGGNTVDLSTLPDLVNDADADPTNEIQSLSIATDQLSISGSNQVDLSPYKDNTDTQTLNLTGTSLSITGGNNVDLSPLQDGVIDADADPTNEIQDLNLTGSTLKITNNAGATEINLAPFAGVNTDEQILSIVGDSLAITNGNKVLLPKQDVIWDTAGTTLFYNDGKVGIGTGNPTGKLEVKGIATANPDEIIFGVLNAAGDTVFAVYQDGVRINIADDLMKGSGRRGGFAVGGISASKATTNREFMRVTPDSVRIYVTDDPGKASGPRGGFAVGGISASKVSFTNEYLRITPDSVRVYVENSPTKASGSRGGFAVGGISSGKATGDKYMYLEPDNYFIGLESGKNIKAGLYNSFLGYQTGYSNTDASNNVFLGYKSGFSNTLGISNVFIGNQTGYKNINGGYNTFLGYQAGFNSTNTNNNTFLGYQAGYSAVAIADTLREGSSNVFIGNQAGKNVSTGMRSVLIGMIAGLNWKVGDGNVFIGYATGSGEQSGNPTGNYNTFIGNEAGARWLTGDLNVTLGSGAAVETRNGARNVLIGGNVNYAYDGISRTSEMSDNVYIGAGVAGSNYYGNRNVIIGSGANGGYKKFGFSGSGNVFIGYQSGLSEQGSNKLYIDNSSTATPLIYGDFTDGYEKLVFNGNVGIGNATPRSKLSMGTYYVSSSGPNSSEQTSHIRLYDDGGSNLYGLGVSTNALNIAANQNTGTIRLYTNSIERLRIDANGNVGIGTTTPSAKLHVSPGQVRLTGSTNPFVGLNNDSYQGYLEILPSHVMGLTYNGAVRIGILTNGNVGIGTTTPANRFDVNGLIRAKGSDWPTSGSGAGVEIAFDIAQDAGFIQSYNRTTATFKNLRLGGHVMPVADNAYYLGLSASRWLAVYAVNGTIQTSDERLKENIKPIDYGLNSILKLKPVSFSWKNDKESKINLGLIAQEVQEVMKEVVDKGTDPDTTLGINYSQIVPVLIKGIQEQQLQIQKLSEQNELLQAQLEEIKTWIKK